MHVEIWKYNYKVVKFHRIVESINYPIASFALKYVNNWPIQHNTIFQHQLRIYKEHITKLMMKSVQTYASVALINPTRKTHLCQLHMNQCQQNVALRTTNQTLFKENVISLNLLSFEWTPFWWTNCCVNYR